MIEWTIGGVNTSSTSGGPVCRNFMPDSWRLRESFMAVGLALFLVIWGYSNLTFPKINKYDYKYQTGKTILLVIFSVAFGIEVGFKFATKTVIYLLNPCHVMTVMQLHVKLRPDHKEISTHIDTQNLLLQFFKQSYLAIRNGWFTKMSTQEIVEYELYLLSVTPSNNVTAIFRLHLSLLNGPILAFLFPETTNRKLPFEKWIYWIQHVLLIIVPIYLLKQGGVYNVEPVHDMSWITLSYGLNMLYHYIFLQPLAIPTEVNLNHMLCPAEKDPFSGPYYRVLAIFHQGIMCPLIYKLACYYFAASVNLDNVERIHKKSKTDNQIIEISFTEKKID